MENLTLFTCQPLEVFDIINKEGTFRCKKEDSYNADYFKNAYEWISLDMEQKGLVKPELNIFPIWAWYKQNFKNKKPDLRQVGLGEKGKNMFA